MGHRTLKRVPLDFDAPLDEVWEGYINPYMGALPCNACKCTGYNPATKHLSDTFYDSDNNGRTWRYDFGFAPDGSRATRPPWRIIGKTERWSDKITQDEVQALVDEGRLWKNKDGSSPTAEEVNKSEHTSFGHDAINRWILIEARARRLGVFGHCEHCNGKGELAALDPAVQEAYENWKPTEPPAGEGYQLWETTTEGSPQNPVFESAEQLANWCAEGASIFAGEKMLASKWLELFESDTLEQGSLLASNGNYTGPVALMPE